MDQNAGQRPLLTYDGNIGELYGIFIKNLLLTIVTVGIYRFWATTALRRYVWSRMRFQDERFEYTGTGGELFKGFLLAMGILIGAMIVAFGLSAILSKLTGSAALGMLPVIVLYAAIGVFAAGAYFSAQRYRLSRTVWCGIRGGMTGSMIRYGVQALLYGLLCIVTLFQAVPWVTVRLAERRINASSFGSEPFRFQGQAGPLYKAFLLSFVGIVVWGVVVGILFLGPAISFFFAQLGGERHVPTRLIVALFSFYLLFIVGALLMRCYYIAKVSQHIVGNTTLGTQLRFGTSITGQRLLVIVISNLAIVVFTLGLGFPIALNRVMHFIADTLLVEGKVDPQSLGQSNVAAPRTGEGALNLLDHGGGF
ncbi:MULTISPECIES: YjgN family protein [Paraburkholderia]|uniref:YjgN family protein n=1 Tax=Paraburkholderia TaxID=1822464 RepID=UPI0022502BE5|nr:MULTISPECIES: YjgN family protein [Paraburkholderia]MCX4162834.1 YjgN family protein [Paraburkholderia megapolitana]MDN7158329.1 YjgN family protein [Paraburkholderia sp. CHISQ3]MDQ6495376.1 YjgN family protein [Paraburkholderia megapolitana]